MIYILPTDTCYWIACPIHEIKAYNGIYKIKKRSYDKPLAILVSDFKWLEENTSLTFEQIEFLKKYEKPFTILTDCTHLKVWVNYIDEDNNEFINRDKYEKFAFRVANNDIQKKLLKKHGPLFMTSVNYTGKPEIYKISEVKEMFWDYIARWKIEFVWEDFWDLEVKRTSDIFEFIWESLEVEYLRKN